MVLSSNIVRRAAADSLIATAETDATSILPDLPYNIFLSQDPFDDYVTLQVDDFGSHITMGMVFTECVYTAIDRNL